MKNCSLATLSTGMTQPETRGWWRSLPVVLAECRDEVALLVFWVHEEDGPVQEALLVLEHLRAGDLLGAEAVQTELSYGCRGRLVLVVAVWLVATSLGGLEQLDASILKEAKGWRNARLSLSSIHWTYTHTLTLIAASRVFFSWSSFFSLALAFLASRSAALWPATHRRTNQHVAGIWCWVSLTELSWQTLCLSAAALSSRSFLSVGWNLRPSSHHRTAFAKARTSIQHCAPARCRTKHYQRSLVVIMRSNGSGQSVDTSSRHWPLIRAFRWSGLIFFAAVASLNEERMLPAWHTPGGNHTQENIVNNLS